MWGITQNKIARIERSEQTTRRVHQAEARHIATLYEARAYLLAIKGGRERREYWQHAAALLMEAADGGDGLEALAAQIELALIMDGALALPNGPGPE
jgi:hypothetical protein